MKKYKFKAPNRTFQLLLPFLCAADNFAIVFLRGACPLYHYRFELEEQDCCTVLYDRKRLCAVQQYLLD